MGFTDFIPIDWFNRFYNKKMLCRRPDCDKPPRGRFQFYCSPQHRKEFLDYYLKFINWDEIKSSIIVRDDWTCKLCGYSTREFNPSQEHRKFEVDHIHPRSLIRREVTEEYQHLPNKMKNSLRIFRQYNIKYLQTANHPDNLRLLCAKCHRSVTADYLGSIAAKQIVRESKRIGRNYKKTQYWTVRDYISDYLPERPWKRYGDPREFTEEEKQLIDLHDYFYDNNDLFPFLVFWDNINNTISPAEELPAEQKFQQSLEMFIEK